MDSWLASFILAVVVIAVLFVIPMWLTEKPANSETQYREGRRLAKQALKTSDKTAQQLIDQCQGDDAWDRGWKDYLETQL